MNRNRNDVNSDEVMMGSEAKRKRMYLAFFLAVCVGFQAMAQGVDVGTMGRPAFGEL